MEITFNITNVCNLKCDYCIFVGLGSDDPIKDSMIQSLSELINFYTDAGEITSFTFSGGGEPTIFFKDIEYVVENLKLNNRELVHFHLITNGVGYSQKVSHFVNKYDIKLVLSLDGIKEEHDKNRVMATGGGSFDKIMEVSDLLFPDVTDINYTLYHNNFDKLQEGVEFIASSIPKLRRLNFNFVFNHDKWNTKNLSILQKRLESFLTWYVKNRKFLSFETNLRNYGHVGTSKFDNACMQHLYVDRDGKIFKCGAYRFIEENYEFIGDLYDFQLSILEDKRTSVVKCGTKCSRNSFQFYNDMLKGMLKGIGQKYIVVDKYIPTSVRKPIY